MISLFYKEFELGVLSFDNDSNEFVYNSNIENEKKADEKYFGLELYNLFGSKNRRSKNLFLQFCEIAGCLNRPDIVRMAGIEKKDNLYQKLEKLSKLKLNDEDYFIRFKK